MGDASVMSDADAALAEMEAAFPDGIEYSNLLVQPICQQYLGEDEDGEEMHCTNLCDLDQQMCYMCQP